MSQAIKLQNTSHDRTKLRASYDPNFDRSLTSLGVDEDLLRQLHPSRAIRAHVVGVTHFLSFGSIWHMIASMILYSLC